MPRRSRPLPTGSRPAIGVVATAAALLLAGCAAVATVPPTTPGSPAPSGLTLPDPRGGFDYQLGGAYDPPGGVTIVERDRAAPPARAGYDICYVNGFQTQPADSAAFAAQHPDLVVQHDGAPLADPGWPDEFLYDTSTPAKRAAVAALVGPWITGCADAGYAAVEIDNLDSDTRSEGVLSADDNLALAAEYLRIAHGAGLAIAQKNTADRAERLRALGYDFAVTESCAAFAECTAYTDVYPVVLDIEYGDELGTAGFDAACADPARPPVMILRDHSLVAPGDPAYLYRACRP